MRSILAVSCLLLAPAAFADTPVEGPAPLAIDDGTAGSAEIPAPVETKTIRRKMRPVPAFLAGTAAGFGAGFLGNFVHPLVGGAIMPLASTFAMHPLTDSRFGYTFIGTHLGWLGSSPVAIPIRVIDRNQTGGALEPLSAGSIVLTASFAVTSAVGGLIAANIDSKNRRNGGRKGKRKTTVAVTPVVNAQQSGFTLSGRF